MFAHTPSLEPRGQDHRQVPWLVNVFRVLTGVGVFQVTLRILDWFGKGEAAIDIYKLLPHIFQFLGNPVLSIFLIAGGFGGLIWQAQQRPERVSQKQLVHPETHLPIYSKPKIWPAIKMPVWVCIIATLIAIPVWACFKTPLRAYISLEKPSIVAVTAPTVPDLHYNHQQTVAPKQTAPPVIAQGTTAPGGATTQPPQQPPPSSPQQTVAPPPNSGCPKEPGKMTSEWNMNTANMMMGGYNLNYSFDQTIVQSFYTFLKQSISPTQKPLTRQQLVKAINLSDDIQSHLPKPAPIQIEQKQIYPDITLTSIRRSFLQNSDYIQYSYSARLPNGQDVGNVPDKLLIKILSPESQRTISEFDQMTKEWGDEACRDAVIRLTKP